MAQWLCHRPAPIIMSEEAVRTNYNRVGLDVIQLMYGDDYLSIGGHQSVDHLAELAGIESGMAVLDLGCGLGGPAVHLAAEYGCYVTGVDLVSASIEQSRTLAGQRGVTERSRFMVADATSVPLPDAQFDRVIGIDAWCHVGDKARLLAECRRLLKPDGRLAFTDWVVLDRKLVPLEVLEAAAAPQMAGPDDYRALLGELAMRIDHDQDISSEFAEQYRQVMARLETQRATIIERFGERVMNVVESKNSAILDAFESGTMGGIRFVAQPVLPN